MNTVKIPCPFSTRLRRCLAWTLDWNIIGAVALAITMVLWAVATKTGQEMLVLISIPVFLAWYVLFILRDVVFGGTSLGKRIMKLRVIDKFTGEAATKKQKALRGLSFFFVAFDALFMLVSGHSIGDRLGDTAVVKNGYTASAESSMGGNGFIITEDGRVVPVKPSKKAVIITIVSVVAVILAFIIFLVTVLTLTFGRIKKSEEYALAYDYLVSSKYFEYYGLSEEDVSLTSYSGTTYGNTNTRYVEITFKIDKKLVKVYCIRENGNWYVSEEDSRLNTPGS